MKMLYLGNHCEDIWFPDTASIDKCQPCSANFSDFVSCLQSKGVDTNLIKYWWEPCEDHLPNCVNDHLAKSNCLNQGVCVAAVEKCK